MATPITHLFLADKFCDKHPKIEKFPFFAGNCLPDIRHIDKTIERTKFHIKDLTIDDVLAEKSDFLKGIKFHSFVDEKRDDFYEMHNIYIPKVSDETFIMSLKFLEDEVLYGNLSSRHDFIKFFFTYQFPINDINETSIKKWKKILCNYFLLQPTESTRKNFILGIGLSENLYEQIENMMIGLRKNNIEDIYNMVEYFEGFM